MNSISKKKKRHPTRETRKIFYPEKLFFFLLFIPAFYINEDILDVICSIMSKDRGRKKNNTYHYHRENDTFCNIYCSTNRNSTTMNNFTLEFYMYLSYLYNLCIFVFHSAFHISFEKAKNVMDTFFICLLAHFYLSYIPI